MILRKSPLLVPRSKIGRLNKNLMVSPITILVEFKLGKYFSEESKNSKDMPNRLVLRCKLCKLFKDFCNTIRYKGKYLYPLLPLITFAKLIVTPDPVSNKFYENKSN